MKSLFDKDAVRYLRLAIPLIVSGPASGLFPFEFPFPLELPFPLGGPLYVVPEVPSPGLASSEEHVLVIGAGAAGMSASYTLEYLGVNYTLLEANGVVGGRAQQLEAGEFLDVPMDLGPEWIHFQGVHTLPELLLFEGQTFDVETETIDWKPKELEWMSGFYLEQKFYNSTWNSYLMDHFYPYIRENTVVNAVVNSVEYSFSSSSSSTDDDDDDDDDDSQGVVVVVSTADGRTFRGTRVIVAVPLSVLQSNDIEFSPPLPQCKRNAFSYFTLPAGFKVLMEFDENFYDTEYNYNPEGNNDFDGVWGKPTDRHVRTVLASGGDARTLEMAQLSEEDLLAEILAELDERYEGKASTHLVQSHVANWYQEPYIRGTWSNIFIPFFIKNQILTPVEDRVYFAGEYLPHKTCFGAQVQVAAISGRKAAIDIYNAITQSG